MTVKEVTMGPRCEWDKLRAMTNRCWLGVQCRGKLRYLGILGQSPICIIQSQILWPSCLRYHSFCRWKVTWLLTTYGKQRLADMKIQNTYNIYMYIYIWLYIYDCIYILWLYIYDFTYIYIWLYMYILLMTHFFCFRIRQWTRPFSAALMTAL
jgi:hypothetical protein